MVWVTDNKLQLAIKPLVEEILASGQMNRNQHFQLASAMLSNSELSDQERRQINRVFDYIQTGRIKLID
ncbi:MAG TPA: hypothetical protein V6C65_12595 [Allocoleopsis sp.]